MRRLANPARFLALCLATTGAVIPLDAFAVPRRSAHARARVVHPAPRRRSAGPPIALQLAGLQIHVPVNRNAVIHALARDAWPQLVQCVAAAPRVHGQVTVALGELAPHGTAVTLEGAPTSRHRALADCVRSALVAVALPPHDGDRPPASVTFDLLLAMPAVGVPPRTTHR